MEIRDLVGGVAAVCAPSMTLAEAARFMLDQGVGSLGVLEGGRLVGILTDRDVLRSLAGEADPHVARVEEWMTVDPDIIEPDTEVAEAANWLLATGYRHLPVVENGRLLGIVSIKDVLWALKEPSEGEGGGR